MKERLKNKLNADEYCANKLKQLQTNGVSFDDLWDKKLYSLSKKGYYVRRLKESLWSIFGVNRIKLFGDNYNDPSSDTYIALIIKSVFPEKERTPANALWVQLVLETILMKNTNLRKLKAKQSILGSIR
ncbi:7509_t:CDS:2 [Funneliformis caledonium]|uniref:7509_t:CDS:1 n=1 Tax=Funneliformis caledonium TaxID=1117310 RepID=A0A9N8V609_9GLOM|nr:7509_t:CDS:2 [Funneliformis caledonium]